MADLMRDRLRRHLKPVPRMRLRIRVYSALRISVILSVKLKTGVVAIIHTCVLVMRVIASRATVQVYITRASEAATTRFRVASEEGLTAT